MRDHWQLVPPGKVSFFSDIVFWHRFCKAEFGYFSCDITVRHLTCFMGMLEVQQKIVSVSLFDLFVCIHSPCIYDAKA